MLICIVQLVVVQIINCNLIADPDRYNDNLIRGGDGKAFNNIHRQRSVVFIVTPLGLLLD